METGRGVRTERRLAAILAADVAGYSRLIGADEEGTLERLRSIRAEVIDPKIDEHRGRLVKTTGDGLLVEFGSVVDALRCATEVQQTMALRNSGLVEAQRIDFRIGLHQGDIVVEDGDIFGDGVNVAARLEGLAEPGGICVSARVQEDVAGRLELTFEDLGEQSVKNIVRPIRAYALTADWIASLPRAAVPSATRSIPLAARHRGRWRIAIFALAASVIVGGGAWWLWSVPNTPFASATAPLPRKETAPAIPPATRLSIVVLPFTNLSNVPDQEYFADTITDDLTTDLSRISGSFVIARTTAFTYKGKPVDAKQIGHDLGVHYVLEGSVRRLDDRVQINVQLIDSETGSHLWAERFDVDRRNLVEAQGEITARLASTLNYKLSSDAANRIEQERIADPGARDLIMRARALRYASATLPANNKKAARQTALDLLNRALTLDPNSIDARIQTANIIMVNVVDGFSDSIQNDKVRAEALIREALERNPNSPSAHAQMGFLRRLQGQWAEANAELNVAVALNPNDSFAVRQLGQVMLNRGKPEAAIPLIEKATRLDPYDPYIYVNYNELANCHLFLGQTDEAIDLYRKARVLNPGIWFIHLSLAGALGLKGNIEEAKDEIAESVKLKPDLTSLARVREYTRSRGACCTPELDVLYKDTLDVGLRRAGFPDE